jgi:hypothetical protein
LQIRWHVGIEAHGWDWDRIENGFEYFRGAAAMKRERARRHLVEDDAEREEVGAGVEIFGTGLLGRHVRNGAERRAGAGQIVFVDAGCVCGGGLAGRSGGRRELGEAEIQHLGVAALGNKDVGRLDVAVDDALGMRGVEAVGNLDGQREHGFVTQRLSADEVFQADAVQKLHGDEGLLTVFADFVDGADVGMIESRGGTRLATKAFQGLRVLREAIGQEFEGYEAAKLGVFGFIDHAHTAPTNLFDDAVVRNGLADHFWVDLFRSIPFWSIAVKMACFRADSSYISRPKQEQGQPQSQRQWGRSVRSTRAPGWRDATSIRGKS